MALMEALTGASIVSNSCILAIELAENQPFALAGDSTMGRLPWLAAARVHLLEPGLYAACDWENKHRYFVSLCTQKSEDVVLGICNPAPY